MIQYEDECVGCPPEMGCLGSICPNRNVPHYFCDYCGEEIDEYWVISDSEEEYICEDCLKEKLYERRSVFD